AERHDEREARYRPLLVLELAAPRHVVAGRHMYRAAHALLHVGDHAAHVAALDEHADRDHARARFARDVHAAAADRYRGHLRQRDARPARTVDEHVPDGLRIAPLLLAEAHNHGEAALALPQLGGGFPAERRLDHVLDVGDVEAVARGARAIDLDLQLRD